MLYGSVIADFVAETQDEISVPQGARVEVLKQDDDGWCWVSYNGAQGLFPGTYLELDDNCEENGNDEEDTPNVEEEPGEELSQEERAFKHRMNVIKELKMTESDYVQDLRTITEVFVKPMMAKNIISREDSSALFSNVETLLTVNLQINDRLAATPDEETLIGTIFSEMADFLKMYTVYCANQPKSISTLERISKQTAVKTFFAECMENPSCRGLTLGSFLIKPIQRICKYPLLLKDLLRHTAESHPDFLPLDVAFKKIQAVVSHVNESKRTAENLQKILDVQNQIESNDELNLVSPSRRFVREGMFTVMEKGKERERNVYLFNDLIVTTKPAKKHNMMGGTKDHFRVQLSLDRARIVDLADTPEIKNACELRPLHADPDNKAYVMIFATPDEKNSWVREIKSLVKEFQRKILLAQKDGTYDPTVQDSPPQETKSSKSRRLGRGTLRKSFVLPSSVSARDISPGGSRLEKEKKPEGEKVKEKKPEPEKVKEKKPVAPKRPPPQLNKAGKVKVDRKVQSLVMAKPPPIPGGAPIRGKPLKGKPSPKPKPVKPGKQNISTAPTRAVGNVDFTSQLSQIVQARKQP